MWRRVARPPISLEIPLDAGRIAAGVPVTGDGVYLAGKLETVGIPKEGTRALALFLVNGREPFLGPQDERCLFQAGLEITFTAGIVARPNRADGDADDWDSQVADLQFRDRCEYAVGHGVSVAAVLPEDGGPVTTVRTAWVPCAEVPRVVTGPAVGITAMEELADLEDGEALRPTQIPRQIGALGTTPTSLNSDLSKLSEWPSLHLVKREAVQQPGLIRNRGGVEKVFEVLLT